VITRIDALELALHNLARMADGRLHPYAIFDITRESPRRVTFAYRSISSSDECVNWCCTSRVEAPFSSMCVASECRSQYVRILCGYRAFSAAFCSHQFTLRCSKPRSVRSFRSSANRYAPVSANLMSCLNAWTPSQLDGLDP